MKNYLEIAYKEKDKPYGQYPVQLARHLMQKYGLQPGMSILDNGCGRGEFLHAFESLGMLAEGTDVSDYCKRAKVVDINRERLPFPDDCFDAVFSKSVIEHIEQTSFYISEMKRVLKPGGVLIIMVPDWETQYKVFYYDPTHIHPYTVKSIEKLLKMSEFSDVSAEKFIQLPCTWDSRIMESVSKVFRLFGAVNRVYRNKFIRFSRELMVLGSGRK